MNAKKYVYGHFLVENLLFWMISHLSMFYDIHYFFIQGFKMDVNLQVGINLNTPCTFEQRHEKICFFLHIQKQRRRLDER